MEFQKSTRVVVVSTYYYYLLPEEEEEEEEPSIAVLWSCLRVCLDV